MTSTDAADPGSALAPVDELPQVAAAGGMGAGPDGASRPATRGRTARTSLVAASLFGLVLAEVVTAVVGSIAAGLSYVEVRDSYLLTNCAIALSFGVAGVLIAWHRPRNPVGWLLLAAAALQGTTAASPPLLVAGVDGGWPEPILRAVGTVAAYGWPWSIGLAIPLALLLFPTGRLPGRRWWPVVWFTVANSVVFTLANGASPEGLLEAPGTQPWFFLAEHDRFATLWSAVEVTNLAVYLTALAGLALRYRRGTERERRQLLWLLLALVTVVGLLVFWGPDPARPGGQLVLVLLVIPLVPAAITVAVLRHQLLDIRLVFSRAVLYALLTAGVVGAYLGLVAAAEWLLRAGPGASLLATVLVAVGFNPVRVRLQRVVDHALYGDRADPARVLARMGEHLSAGGDLDGVLAAVARALRLPHLALDVDGGRIGAVGERPVVCEPVQLRYRGEQVGELVVGVRSGQRALDPADRAALELLAAPLAVAVHATTLTATVQRAREQVVVAREEERRRLRRDLHDGLGPALTGIAFRADAAGNLLRADPDGAALQLAALRAEATAAITDVRRLVHALRPPALDELGLVGALRRQAEQLAVAGPAITVHALGTLPALPAAVEAAAYRIAVEALTNAVRHACAAHVTVTLAAGRELELCVRDDGSGDRPWRPGVGMCSMGERAAELGGSCEAGPAAAGGGGTVQVRLPLGDPR